MGLPPEIQKQIKLLELKTRRLVNNTFAGQYHSAFKGQGMTFAEFREYVPGDDVRSIAWNVTARTGRTFVKKFDEERELTLMLMADVSGSTLFGSRNYFKGEAIAHLAALLSFSASANNDQIGLILFSDRVEHYVPPKKGRAQVQRILRDLYYFKPQGRQSNFSPAFEYAVGVLKKRSTIFIFSDFLADNYERELASLGRKHDVIAVTIQDPAELQLPKVGLVQWQDSETGEIILVDASSRSYRRRYEEQMRRWLAERDASLRRARVDRIEVNLDSDIVDPLVLFFRQRLRR